MELENTAIATRLRSPWQALDLGVVMARHWYPVLFLSWATPAAGAFLLLHLLLFQHPFWALFVIWWLKPFWDRLPLYFASRALFGEQPPLKTLLAQLPTVYKSDGLPWLLWRRLSFQRSFVLPVTLLENLKGQARDKRLNLLHNDHTSAPLWLTVILFHIEQVLPPALAVIALLFVPEWKSVPYSKLFETYNDNTLWQWGVAWSFFLSMAAIAPFYVCGGFMAYINRRIALEGWDIELRLRAMVRRLQPRASSAALLIVVLCGLTSAIPQPASARELAPEQTRAREAILAIVESEDFINTKTVARWQLKDRDDSAERFPEWLLDWLEWLARLVHSSDANDDFIFALAWRLRFIFVALVGLGIVLLLYRLARHAGMIRIHRARPAHSPLAKPEMVFGLAVTPESLPGDVTARALQLLAQGQFHTALRLLYRASLSRFINQFALPLQQSQTELECATTVRREIDRPSTGEYFEHLTDVWLQLAYAHRPPERVVAEDLCRRWREHFEAGGGARE